MKRARLAQRRRVVGLSQEMLAEQLGVDRSTVIRWERGVTSPQPWQRPNLASALEVSLNELDALLDTNPLARSAQAAPPVSSHPALLRGVGDGSDDLATIQLLRLADRQVGGTQLYATVIDYLRHTVAPRLFGTVDHVADHNLFTAAAALTEMAGWMAHDAGRDDTAEQHFQRALGLAAAGNDRKLGAHILASLGHLCHHRRQPERALRYVRQGRQRLVGHQHPDLQSRLFAMEARGLAMLRQRTECAKMLRSSERSVELGTEADDSAWASSFDYAALAAEAARCFRDLGQLASAKRYAEQVITLRPADRPRSRAFAQLMLVSILVSQGKIDHACAVAREALDATRLVRSYLVLEQLDNVRRILAAHRRVPEVTTFLEVLEHELTSRRAMQGFASSTS
jgi:transcriptional regulator with XRE-family HTH domain